MVQSVSIPSSTESTSDSEPDPAVAHLIRHLNSLWCAQVHIDGSNLTWHLLLSWVCGGIRIPPCRQARGVLESWPQSVCRRQGQKLDLNCLSDSGPYQTSKPISSDPGWHTNWPPTSRSHCTSPLGLTATWWKGRMTTCIDSLAQTVKTHSHWFLHRQTRRRDVKLRKSSKLHEGVKDPIAGTEGETWLSGHRWEMTKAGTDAHVFY